MLHPWEKTKDRVERKTMLQCITIEFHWVCSVFRLLSRLLALHRLRSLAVSYTAARQLYVLPKIELFATIILLRCGGTKKWLISPILINNDSLLTLGKACPRRIISCEKLDFLATENCNNPVNLCMYVLITKPHPLGLTRWCYWVSLRDHDNPWLLI